MSISFLYVSRQSFHLLARVCVCVLSAPSSTPNCKCTFSWQALLPETCHSILLFPSVYCWRCLPCEDKFSTQACWLLLTSWSVMKAFRCLETYHFPQLCIPELHSNETYLYHSHDNFDIICHIFLETQITLLIYVYIWKSAIMKGKTHLYPICHLDFMSVWNAF